MRRRAFIKLLGIAAIWPPSAFAEKPSIPRIGFLTARSGDESADSIAAFRECLREAGHIEQETVAIKFWSANGEYDRLPELAADLVKHSVSAIVTSGGDASAHAAKKATTTVPIVSLLTDDPLDAGLVTSLAHPGGNLTGVNFLTTTLEPKRLQLLHDVVPYATKLAMLVNPKNRVQAEIELKEVPVASAALGLQLAVFRASDANGIKTAFETISELKIQGLLVASDTFERRDQITALAARHNLPGVYFVSEFAKAGGLMSYGTNIRDAYRQLGLQTARVLNGAKPADLPVMQSVKFEFVINLRTAKALGLTIPPSLLATAEEVIE